MADDYRTQKGVAGFEDNPVEGEDMKGESVTILGGVRYEVPEKSPVQVMPPNQQTEQPQSNRVRDIIYGALAAAGLIGGTLGVNKALSPSKPETPVKQEQQNPEKTPVQQNPDKDTVGTLQPDK